MEQRPRTAVRSHCRDLPTLAELARFTFEQASDPVFWLNAEGRFVDANRAACDQLGYSREELLERRVFDIDVEVMERSWPARWDELRTVGSRRIESTHRHRDGSEFPVEITGHFIRLDGEEFICSFARDLTARREAEREIRRGRQWIELVADAAALGLWDWNINEGTKICNDEYFRTLGWSRETLDDGFESYRSLLHPEDRDQAYDELRRHLAGQTAMIDSEYRIRAEDGRWIWVLDRGRVLERDVDGRPVRVAGVIQDITKRKLDERRAARLARLERICQEIAVSFVRDSDESVNGMLRRVGEFLDVSRSYVFCLQEDGTSLCNTHEWCDRGVASQIDSLQHVPVSPLEALIGPMRSRRPIVIADLRCAEIDRAARDHLEAQSIRATIGLPYFIAGRLRGFIGFDETRRPREWQGEEIALLQAMVETFARAVERREAEQARMTAARQLEAALRDAEAANQAKDAFLAHMSHELRTPLTAVLGFAEILERGTSTSSSAESLIAQIRANGRHLLGIINDLLDLSRIEADKIEPQLARADLRQLLTRAVRMLQPMADNKRLPVRLRVVGNVPASLTTDEPRVLQILTNLLSNAVKYTEAGHVEFVASCEGSTLRLCVNDTGVGIAAERLSSIFEPFERDNSDPRRQGTGLGLPICRRLAALLGGRISCRSTLGVGSSFALELPAVPEAPWLERGEIAVGQEAGDGGNRSHDTTGQLAGLRVLLVEDCKQNRDVIEFFLQEQGALISCCSDGEAALERMGKAPDEIDLVLMDMRMPRMDGYAATRAARQAGFCKPIIAITAHGLAQDRDRCFAAGCDEYVTKPIDSRRLVEVCRRLAADVRPAISGDAPGPPVSTVSRPGGLAAGKLMSLIDEYLAALPSYGASIEEAFASGAIDEICIIAHRLAGSAGSYGLPELSSVARCCEQAIRQGAEPSEIERRVGELLDEVRDSASRRPEELRIAGVR
ncbi:MAG: PAS domain S-box protein [Planctomycetota bacterium]|jgi:PAS domain S-box-containing protein